MTKVIKDYIDIIKRYCIGLVKWMKFVFENKDEIVANKAELDEYISLYQPK